MIFLDVEDLLRIAERVVGPDVRVRDPGLLHAAAERPRATVFGVDAYPTLHVKAAALLHSIVGNHALIDGNKRLGLASVIGFLGMNGWRLTMSEDEAFHLVMNAAAGRLDDVESIAEYLKAGSAPMRRSRRRH